MGKLSRDRAALLGGLALFAGIYTATLCPTVYWYDSAEFSAHAAGLGVPHPPGYPLYTLIAHLFTYLPGEAALGVNLMSLVFGLGALLLTFHLVRRLGGSLAAATVALATLGSAKTFWGNAIMAEVYTPGLVFTLGTFALLESAHRNKDPRKLYGAGLLAGLGVGVHMSIATCGLGYAFLVLSLDGRPRDRGLRALLSGLGASLGLLVFLYIPLVSFKRWNLREWRRFQANATGGTFKRKFLEDYDFGARLKLVLDILADNLHWIGIALALLGAFALVRKQRKLGIGLGLGAAGNLYFFFNYRVPDLDVFFLPAIAIACMFIGFGAEFAAELAARRHPALRHLSWLAVGLAVAHVLNNYKDLDLSESRSAAEYGQAACDAVPEDAVVVLYSSPTEWRYYSVFIYVQKGLRQCEGVKVWRKPKLSTVKATLRQGKPVYTFRPVKKLAQHFRLEKAGVLWRVQLRNQS